MADLTITWDGKDYRVPEDRVFELIEAIERHITLPDLMLMIGGGRPNFSALARPFHEMLTHAGVRNPPNLLDLRRMLVAEGMANVKAKADGSAQVTGSAMQAIGAMVEILMDGAPDMQGEPEKPKKKTKSHSRKAATKSQSGNGG